MPFQINSNKFIRTKEININKPNRTTYRMSWLKTTVIKRERIILKKYLSIWIFSRSHNSSQSQRNETTVDENLWNFDHVSTHNIIMMTVSTKEHYKYSSFTYNTRLPLEHKRSKCLFEQNFQGRCWSWILLKYVVKQFNV